eukprot:3200370-Prymnesium_polylepis.1
MSASTPRMDFAMMGEIRMRGSKRQAVPRPREEPATRAPRHLSGAPWVFSGIPCGPDRWLHAKLSARRNQL